MSVLEFSNTLSILIVEDDLLLGVRVAAVLEDLKFDVVGIATTAPEACSVAQTSRPNLALVDRRLASIPCWTELPRTLNTLGIPTILIGEPACEPNRHKEVRRGLAPLDWVGTLFRPSQIFNELMVAMGTAS
jgi:two-component system, response regulator PdtaR